MVIWHENSCRAVLPLSKTDPKKTSLKSFHPNLPKRDHNQSCGKMSARCSALFPAQTMTKTWGTLLTFLFSIDRSLSSHTLFVRNLLMVDLLSKALISQYSFLFSTCESGLASFPTITYLPHVIDGDRDRGRWAAIKVYNWNFLNYRTQEQDTKVVRKKCLLVI